MIQIEQHEKVSILTLNRPEKHNALNIALLEELFQAIQSFNGDALILRGNGPSFCSGMDLKEAAVFEFVEPLANLIAKVLITLYTAPFLTFAAVHGHILAGGAGVMSACDFVVAADDAMIGYPEIHKNLVAAQVSTLLIRQVGWRYARELLLLGKPITSLKAQEIGLVNCVAPQEHLLTKTLELVQSASAASPVIIAETKRLLRTLEARPFESDLSLAVDVHLKIRRQNLVNNS